MSCYSIDLRQRAVDAHLNGKSKSQTCLDSQISRPTLDQWLNKFKEQGNLVPITTYQKGHSHIITDWESFTQFVQNTTFDTLKQLAAAFEQYYHKPIAINVLWLGLQRIGMSHKKRPSPIKKLMKQKDESTRTNSSN